MATKAKKSELLFFVEPHHLMRSRQPALLVPGSRVVKEHAFDSDVSNIMAKYKRTGEIPMSSRTRVPGAYGDVSSLAGADYGQLREQVDQAKRDVVEAQRKEAELKEKAKAAIKAAKASSSSAALTPNVGTPAA